MRSTEKRVRYVFSAKRLVQMMSHEYELLEQRLSENRGKDTFFFAFANTVSALNYQRTTNVTVGWAFVSDSTTGRITMIS